MAAALSQAIRSRSRDQRDTSRRTLAGVALGAEAGAKCGKNEKSLTFNQIGPKGDTGATGPTEGVNSIQRNPPIGQPTPTVLESETTFGQELASDFTTTKSGKLYLSKSFEATLNCVGGTHIWWWIELDNVPVRGTLSKTQTDYFAQTLTGVTDASVPAGFHSLNIGAQCANGTHGGTAWSGYSAGSAIVLGN